MPRRLRLGVREKKIRIYEFRELSPKAKAKAVQDYRDDPDLVWDQDDSERLSEFFEDELDETYGLGEMEPCWSLNYCQGDGVAFKGQVDVPRFIGTEKLEGEFGRLVDLVGVKIIHRDRYCHWNSMDVEIENFAREEDVARKEDLELIGEWGEELAEIRERWRMEWSRAKEESMAPIRDWEERKARHERETADWQRKRGRGPKAWLPGEPPPFDEPKPAPLDIPLPPEPKPEPPRKVAAAQERAANAWKVFEELVSEFESHLEDRIKEISKELEKAGYAEIEYHSGDDYITERLENLDWEFLEDGSVYEE